MRKIIYVASKAFKSTVSCLDFHQNKEINSIKNKKHTGSSLDAICT
jgi:hypothetical protein